MQLDDAKIPSRPFTVRCPKCQTIINGQPQAAASGDQSALDVGDSSSLLQQQFKQPTPARAYRPDGGVEEKISPFGADNPAAHQGELLQVLAALLQRGATTAEPVRSEARLSWERRRLLICVTPARREAVAKVLADSEYDVFIAEDIAQAIESLRHEHMDIVLLDPEFDSAEQGAAFVMREVNLLRPAERRRLFFMQFSAAARTLDMHQAFLHNFNLVVNTGDIENLPHALERSLRDYNDLYRDFNRAMNVADL